MENVKRTLTCGLEKQRQLSENMKKNLEEQQDKLWSEDAAVRVDNFIFPPLQHWAVAINSNVVETTGCCPPQMAKKHISCLLERFGNKRASQDENRTTQQ